LLERRAEHVDPADPAAAGGPHVLDPLQGIDPNGRIPAIERPADLPNPERWRYIPEGRLKPGNLFQRFLVSSMIAPFVFYDSDVGVGFGVALVDIDFREQRRREFAGAFLSYTTEGQQNYTFVWRRWAGASCSKSAAWSTRQAATSARSPAASSGSARRRTTATRRATGTRSASSKSASITRCRTPETIWC
jgi:hypothetical protein